MKYKKSKRLLKSFFCVVIKNYRIIWSFFNLLKVFHSLVYKNYQSHEFCQTGSVKKKDIFAIRNRLNGKGFLKFVYNHTKGKWWLPFSPRNLQNLNVGVNATRRLFWQISKKNTNLFNIIMHIIWCEGSIDHL